MTTLIEITRTADLLWYLLSASSMFLLVDFLRAIYRKWTTPKLLFRECWPGYRLLTLSTILWLLALYLLFPPSLPKQHGDMTPNELADLPPIGGQVEPLVR